MGWHDGSVGKALDANLSLISRTHMMDENLFQQIFHWLPQVHGIGKQPHACNTELNKKYISS